MLRLLAALAAVSHALVAPSKCASQRSVSVRSDYLDAMSPAEPAAVEKAAPAAPPVPAPPAPISLSESVLGEFSARSERNLDIARLQTQLERSQLRRKQVEEVIGEEVAALRFQLEREMIAEKDRSTSAAQLQQQLADAKAQKMERCRQEEQLLVQLQDVRQRGRRAALALVELLEVQDPQLRVEALELLRRVRDPLLLLGPGPRPRRCGPAAERHLRAGRIAASEAELT